MFPLLKSGEYSQKKIYNMMTKCYIRDVHRMVGDDLTKNVVSLIILKNEFTKCILQRKDMRHKRKRKSSGRVENMGYHQITEFKFYPGGFKEGRCHLRIFKKGRILFSSPVKRSLL